MYKNSFPTSEQHSASLFNYYQIMLCVFFLNKVFAYAQNSFKNEVPVHTIK